jgi:hypothetical protein
MGQKPIEGSTPSLSATFPMFDTDLSSRLGSPVKALIISVLRAFWIVAGPKADFVAFSLHIPKLFSRILRLNNRKLLGIEEHQW